MDTQDLIKKAKQGDKEALISLVMSKKDEYYKLAYSYLRNKEDSLDSLQDMIIILFDNMKTLRNDEVFYSWSKTILVNCCKKTLKKNSRLLPFSSFADKSKEEGSYNQDKEASLDILEYMKNLNSQQQEAIRLKYLLDMDYRTISEITKVPEGTVKSRIFNGIKKLKELIGGEYK